MSLENKYIKKIDKTLKFIEKNHHFIQYYNLIIVSDIYDKLKYYKGFIMNYPLKGQYDLIKNINDDIKIVKLIIKCDKDDIIWTEDNYIHIFKR